jgi:Arc/MetJ-type ribon-helix-helix transcriptional regulator
MTIHLPESLKTSLLEAVVSGRYASLDHAMAEAASMLIERLKHEQAAPHCAVNSEEPNDSTEKPIWQEILDMTADVPDDEWDKLPTDLSEQHDHYLYGTPRQTTA